MSGQSSTPSPGMTVVSKWLRWYVSKMPAKINDDYSKYPEEIRDAIPYIVGELCELRQSWAVFHHLFMDDPERAEMMGKSLGQMLAMFRGLLQDKMILILARLTDQDRGPNQNLSIWRLKAAIPSATSPDFESKVASAFSIIEKAAKAPRTYRHKRIAHSDYRTSVKVGLLPFFTMGDIRLLIEELEKLWNLFGSEFADTTVWF